MNCFNKCNLSIIGMKMFQKLKHYNISYSILNKFSYNFRKNFSSYTCKRTFFKGGILAVTSSAFSRKGFSMIDNRKVLCSSDITPKFDLIIFIGGVGKRDYVKRIQENAIQLASGENSKVELYGEDSAFALVTPRYTFLGVADGVGGYHDVGIDPSIFSYTLMKFCSIVANKQAKTHENPNCKKIIEDAYYDLVQLKDKVYGGSTVIASYFDHITGDFNVSNLGDSRVMVIQPKEGQMFLSEEQQHYFNCPFQLSNVPYQRKGRHVENSALDTADFSFKLSDGDMILIGTDGFFDNMFKEEVFNIVKAIKNDSKNIGEMYRELLTTARMFSHDDRRISPFSVQYTKHKNKQSIGGKEDDITLIFAIVVEREK